MIEVFHADSLSGPMSELKRAFEQTEADLTINLIAGRSKELADRIVHGTPVDVLATSDPQVIKQSLMSGYVSGNHQAGAGWYVIFSANELVIITGKGNPHGIKGVTDLGRISFVRVAGPQDLATARTIEFLKRQARVERQPGIVNTLIERASRVNAIPDAVQAIKSGRADASVVYLSAAVANIDAVDYLTFAPEVNLSDQIRNAITIPATAADPHAATKFVSFILSPQGRSILEATGQPPIYPVISEGPVPKGILPDQQTN